MLTSMPNHGDMATAMAGADRAASNKISKYMKLAKIHHFTPVTIETDGSWNDRAIEFITELVMRITR